MTVENAPIPVDLGEYGRELWQVVHKWLKDHQLGPLTLDPHEVIILSEACRTADRLAQLRSVLADADLSDARNVRLLAEERMQRGALTSLLTVKLGLPSGIADELPDTLRAQKGTTAKSRRARAAAQSRWGTGAVS